MPDSSRLWIIIAGLSGAFTVGLGAYGWHTLDEGPDYLRESFNIGVQYHMWHTLALIGVAWLCKHGAKRLASFAGCAFCSGIILFSGSLYYFGLTSELLISGAAPLGGGCFMLGWALLALSAIRAKAKNVPD
ncbi:MAG: DUF423 domain-containing protein [Rhodospirillales bacterium]|nr:DUF423 domain-containing protein [Rhodospirillales bacterium]